MEGTEALESKGTAMGETFFVKGDILRTGNIKVAPKPTSLTREAFKKSFSFSCELEPSEELAKLMGEANSQVDVFYMVRERRKRVWPRYPRKMKKALKKLTMPDQRMTRLMNRLKNDD